jgi:hypothetical protein
MINFDNIPDMFEQLKAFNFRIYSMNAEVLFQSENKSANEARVAFEELKEKLFNYGKIQVRLCNDSNVAQGWKNGFLHTAFFSVSEKHQPQQQQQQQAQNIAGLSMLDIINLKVENAVLKMQLAAPQQQSNALPEIPASYLPLLSAFGLNMAQPGLAGEPQRHTLTHELTEEEKAQVDSKLTDIENTVGSILGKTDIDKVIKVLKAVDNNPALLDSVLPFIK